MPSRQMLANAIRFLSIDAVQKANSGHPGAPMGMADIAEVLWNNYLQHNPNNPTWINRDRFVLSNGHASMMLYALLHLTGYAVSLEDLQQFRQLHSKTPGHPENGITPGVETTTGPLGQGLANAVGMAIAERTLAAQFNRNGHQIIDHFTYVFLGDGCLMEGISHEVCSLAGTLGLRKLIAFYDSNRISIDGHVDNWFSDDTAMRFRAYGWHVIESVDGHDPEQIIAAIESARAKTDKPSLICCNTVIAQGAPNLADSHKAHGAPLGAEEIAATRTQLGWEYAPFVIPEEIYGEWDARDKGEHWEGEWNKTFIQYRENYPELAAEFVRRIKSELPKTWETKSHQVMIDLQSAAKTVATRKASQMMLEQIGPMLPELLGGSADLSESNCTLYAGSQPITRQETTGNYLHYGVREFGMAAIMNGIALHGGFIPYGGTFLVFSDYARNAIRLSALMRARVIYVLTHDSIGLGEDGPTHQPIEHANMLRMTPHMSVWRPCDAVETAAAWKCAIERQNGPTCLLLSRQNLAAMPRNETALHNVQRGGYVLLDCAKEPDAILLATGSEVELIVEAAKQLQQQGKNIRVVSMPCCDVFDAQSKAYRESVLPDAVRKRVAIEAGATAYWYKYVGLDGKVIGIDRFGESAPYQPVYQALGLTVEHIVKAVTDLFN